MRRSSPIYALVPAGGSGSRMGSAVPKQYLEIDGRPVLWHTLRALIECPDIEKIALVVAPDDQQADVVLDSEWSERVEVVRCGGATRAHSVRNGLRHLHASGEANAWVLVHDAARPCLTQIELSTLIETLVDDAVGGILALPVADTVKRADALGRVAATVPRDSLWRAQTPQMFRLQTLLDALRLQPDVTDEAQAIESLGLSPRLVPGKATNLKVTFPEDLALAAMILQAQRVPLPTESTL
jgi:2-C-methyl-D-erythritol 4-phosphate cytidylyltransferase